ncbi:MAG: 4'-phosphopantetheinyl transferase superfamily protein, partial [Spirochaetia bacterium]|nr:4'-phosphopantetheinyl transferase superfamily protein [Spirochaetia bacterium]
MENKAPHHAARFKPESLVALHLERKEGLVPAWLCLTSDDCFESLEPSAAEFLHPKELEKFRGLAIAKRRASFLLGRYSLKKAAGAFLGVANFKALEIRSAILEYPILKYPEAEIPDLTLSHADRIGGAIAFQAGHVMGLDVEWLNPARKKVFERILTKAEHAHCTRLPTDDLELFGVYWTFKEALSKAVKCGFTVPFHI